MSCERRLCFYCQLNSANQSEELSAWLSQSEWRTVSLTQPIRVKNSANQSEELSAWLSQSEWRTQPIRVKNCQPDSANQSKELSAQLSQSEWRTVSLTQPIRVKNCQLNSANQSEELSAWLSQSDRRTVSLTQPIRWKNSDLSRWSTLSVLGDLRDAIAGVIQNLLQRDKHPDAFVRRFHYEMLIQTDRRDKTSTFSNCMSEMSFVSSSDLEKCSIASLGSSAVNGCRQNAESKQLIKTSQ